MTTKDLINAYFSDPRSSKFGSGGFFPENIDKPLLYEYEDKIGKPLIRMTGDEIIEMVKYILTDGGEKKYFASFYTPSHKIRLIKNILDYYSAFYEHIENPLSADEFIGVKLISKIARWNEGNMSWKFIEDILIELRRYIEIERCEYIELIFRLFYDGISDMEELANIKDEHIDHVEKEIHYGGRVIYLSDRTHFLLVKLHNTKVIRARQLVSYLASWNGSYFKFQISSRSLPEFDNKPVKFLSSITSNVISLNVNKRFDVRITLPAIYRLGFADKMKTKYGEEEIEKILESNAVIRDSILKDARDYGFPVTNTTFIKNIIRYNV